MTKDEIIKDMIKVMHGVDQGSCGWNLAVEPCKRLADALYSATYRRREDNERIKGC